MMLLLILAPVVAMGIRIHSSPRFSMKEATTFSRLAQIVYCNDSPAVRDWSCKSCVESQIPMVPGTVRIIEGGTENADQVMIGRIANKPGCFLSIRGSDNAMNWVRDFQTVTRRTQWKNCSGCYIHGGYEKIWGNMEPLVLPALAEIGCKPGSNNASILEVTGHSLGAGVTQVAMMSLANRGFTIGNSYAFESPRVGNGRFSDDFQAKFGKVFWRITHYKDPIPHVPYQAFGYYHTGTEVYFNGKNNYKICHGREDPQCMNQHWHIVYNALFVGARSQHCGNDGFGKNFDFCRPTCTA